ncbi:hypothetical protein [Serinibacter arcticus]|uniref:DUF4282 domain-containing protein n=1 Tax=Serinibacter arcticus TaxID=1655435 RepID=A0A4Z1DZB4_9MICO|nr:hypothetical protein [Serinibacter arcticus]TGO04340.1 hypothetical protein SERN_1933 [Serinibacter arcticus]
MSQPYDPSGPQQSPWGASPASQQQQGAPSGYGQQPGYPQGQPQQGQPGQQGQPHPGQHGQQPPPAGYGAPGAQIPGYGGPGGPAQQQWPAPAAKEPGAFARLFDTSVTKLISPSHLKGAMVLVIIVAAGVTLRRVSESFFYFGEYAGVGEILFGVLSLVLAAVYGLAVLLVGRFAIELLAHVAAIRERGAKGEEKE